MTAILITSLVERTISAPGEVLFCNHNLRAVAGRPRPAMSKASIRPERRREVYSDNIE